MARAAASLASSASPRAAAILAPPEAGADAVYESGVYEVGVYDTGGGVSVRAAASLSSAASAAGAYVAADYVAAAYVTVGGPALRPAARLFLG